MTYVRRAMGDDLREVLALARRFHSESPIHSQLPWSEDKVENLIRVALDDPDWLALVTCDDDGIMGLGLFWCLPEFYSEEKVAGDFVLYVMPERRGSRAAMQILDYVLQWADRRGARAFRLGVHTGINHDVAVRFFKRRGLEEAGVLMSTKLPF